MRVPLADWPGLSLLRATPRAVSRLGIGALHLHHFLPLSRVDRNTAPDGFGTSCAPEPAAPSAIAARLPVCDSPAHHPHRPLRPPTWASASPPRRPPPRRGRRSSPPPSSACSAITRIPSPCPSRRSRVSATCTAKSAARPSRPTSTISPPRSTSTLTGSMLATP